MNLIRRDKFVALIFLSNQIAYLREYLNTGNPEHKSNAVYHGVWLLCEVVDEDTFYKFANIDFQNASEETLKDLIEIKKIILQRVQEDPPRLRRP